MSEENASAGSASVEPIPPDGPIGGVPLAKPTHIQRLELAVRLNSFLDFVDQCMVEPKSEEEEKDSKKNLEEIGREFVPESQLVIDTTQELPTQVKPQQDIISSDTVAKAERRADKRKFFNFGKVKKNRRWLKAILLSDSSSDPDDDEEEDASLSKDDLREMLRLHKFRRQCKNQFYIESELQQYQYYGAGLLSNFDKFLEHQRSIIGPKKGKKTSSSSKLKEKLKRERERKLSSGDLGEPQMMQDSVVDYDGSVAVFQDANRKFTSIKDVDARRRRIWLAIAKRDIPKAHKHRASVHNNILTNCRKMAQACQKELRRTAIQSQRLCKETPYRARRLTREMMAFWKHFEKVEKEHRKKAEKEAQEQRRIDDEIREAKRGQRKLNFLITQTELYAHFMSRKLTGQGDEERDRILNLLDEKAPQRQRTVKEGVLVDIEADDYDSEYMKQRALNNVICAYNQYETSKEAFDSNLPPSAEKKESESFSLSTPTLETNLPQPSIFRGTLKCYQLKGMNWLVNLYDCGINGILADEMGLGKTVQSIAFLAHLAESQGIWGPFLVVAPASTLHNWTQECSRFVPKLKVLPYWGNPQDRKTLRKFWGQRPAVLHTEEAEFHILVTSYQLVVQDIKYFQRIPWHYMILDEAQAIKSSASVRWKLLLGFNCRNRLLLTGTPIQNSMAELWALLHFIMPTLFDSHEEFNDWFSKDIENSISKDIEKQSGVNEEQLSRLHMILKPFMLRRVKKDVENELSDKIEILMYCQLSTRQRLFYQAIKNKISIEDLLRSQSSTTSATATTTNNLMNLVMQFRKVCNHPELFEKRDTRSPYHIQLDEVTIPKLLYQDVIVGNNSLQNKLLRNKLSIFAADNIHHSLFPSPRSSEDSSSQTCSTFSFTRFVDISPGELEDLNVGGLLAQWMLVFLVLKSAYRVYQDQLWKESTPVNQRLLLIRPMHAASLPSISTSKILDDLIFTSWTTTLASHCTHVYHRMAETGWHQMVRTRNAKPPATPISSSSPTSSISPGMASPHRHKGMLHSSPHTPKSPGSSKEAESPSSFKQSSSGLLSPRRRPSTVRRCQRTQLPAFLFDTAPKVLAAPLEFYCKDRGASYKLHRLRQGGDSMEALQCVKHGSAEIFKERRANLLRLPPRGGLDAIRPVYGWSKIQIPDKDYLMTDSGKMQVLDELLSGLKDQGHRVLIYSQMTRMIDILEEFMWHRKHTYMRLDGSSKISDRRDMVAGFQARTDVFVFLLSTRAGGLGINLTAADTVIFYDSDWNPTVDQQAMDRAHRLGQTKQVTVYRLICKGTIEEHILERAREKSEIQRMVITGGNFKMDQLKPKEVVSLLLDDEDIERKYRLKQKEKRNSEGKTLGKDRKRKRDKEIDASDAGKKSKGDVVPESSNLSIDGEDSLLSLDSAAPSPLSTVSVGSESNPPRSQTLTPVPQDENSMDSLVIVDESSNQMIEGDDQGGPGKQRIVGKGVRTKTSPSASKKASQRIGRPRKGIAAAAMAGARAGAVAGTAAAYAAYGFSLVGKQEVSGSASASTPATQTIPPPSSTSANTSPDGRKTPTPSEAKPPAVLSSPAKTTSPQSLTDSKSAPQLSATSKAPLLSGETAAVKETSSRTVADTKLTALSTSATKAPAHQTLGDAISSLTSSATKSLVSQTVVDAKSSLPSSSTKSTALQTMVDAKSSVISSATESPISKIVVDAKSSVRSSATKSPVSQTVVDAKSSSTSAVVKLPLSQSVIDVKPSVALNKTPVSQILSDKKPSMESSGNKSPMSQTLTDAKPLPSLSATAKKTLPQTLRDKKPETPVASTLQQTQTLGKTILPEPPVASTAPISQTSANTAPTPPSMMTTKKPVSQTVTDIKNPPTISSETKATIPQTSAGSKLLSLLKIVQPKVPATQTIALTKVTQPPTVTNASSSQVQGDPKPSSVQSVTKTPASQTLAEKKMSSSLPRTALSPTPDAVKLTTVSTPVSKVPAIIEIKKSGEKSLAETIRQKEEMHISEERKSQLSKLLSNADIVAKKPGVTSSNGESHTKSVLVAVSPTAKAPTGSSAVIPARMSSNQNSIIKISPDKLKDVTGIKIQTAVKLNSPLLSDIGRSKQLTSHTSSSKTSSPTESKPVSSEGANLLSSSEGDQLASSPDQAKSHVITVKESRGPPQENDQTSPSAKKPRLSPIGAPVQVKPSSPVPLDLSPGSGKKSPRRAKSPVSSSPTSRSPHSSKSPAHRSPGRQSPAQVAPLDLRAKPPTSTIKDTSPLNSGNGKS